MKKENRKLAQQRRAEERQRMERQKKLKKYLAWGLPIAAILILIIVLIVYNSNQNNNSDESAGNTNSESTVTDSSESTGFSTDGSLTVKDGDTVNIDYVGSVDGVEFEGGNTNGAGTDLVIGSHSYIDDFEDQLIGHHPGETVEVNVTFPKNYGKENLNGKDALFKVTINGIYE